MGMKQESTQFEQRISAARLSGGISNDAIYDAFLNVLKELKLTGDVLDFGAGTGALMKRLAESFSFRSVTGIDILPSPQLPAGISWISADLNDQVPLNDQSYDVITSSEVIEHLENPRAIIREWFRLLRPSGHLVFSTPNNESIRSLIALFFRGHFAGFGEASYPAHITALLRKDIERILSETGFQLDKFRFTNRGGLPGKPDKTWQMLSMGMLRGLRFSDNIIVVARKP